MAVFDLEYGKEKGKPNAMNINSCAGLLSAPYLYKCMQTVAGSICMHGHCMSSLVVGGCRVALFGCLKLCAGGVCLIGIDCSSWGAPARGTTWRNLINNAVGLAGRSMVDNGSKMASRLHGCYCDVEM